MEATSYQCQLQLQWGVQICTICCGSIHEGSDLRMLVYYLRLWGVIYDNMIMDPTIDDHR